MGRPVTPVPHARRAQEHLLISRILHQMMWRLAASPVESRGELVQAAGPGFSSADQEQAKCRIAEDAEDCVGSRR